MEELFDAIFFPKRFFLRKELNFSASIWGFLIVYCTNFAFLSLIFPFLFKELFILFFFLVIFPFFLFFLFFGMDLTFANFDRNHRLKNHYGFTYCPYLFLPISLAFAFQTSIFPKIFGFSLFILLFLWSSLLTIFTCEKKAAIVSKAIHDFIVFYFLLKL